METSKSKIEPYSRRCHRQTSHAPWSLQKRKVCTLPTPIPQVKEVTRGVPGVKPPNLPFPFVPFGAKTGRGRIVHNLTVGTDSLTRKELAAIA